MLTTTSSTKNDTLSLNFQHSCHNTKTKLIKTHCAEQTERLLLLMAAVGPSFVSAMTDLEHIYCQCDNWW